MSTANLSSTESYRSIVSKVVADARDTAGNAEALSVQLRDIGIRSERGDRYSVSAISNWVQGRTMPPADVFLAVTQLGGQSLDAELGMSTEESPAVLQLQSAFAEMQAELMNLRAQVGMDPSPTTAAQDTRRTGTDS